MSSFVLPRAHIDAIVRACYGFGNYPDLCYYYESKWYKVNELLQDYVGEVLTNANYHGVNQRYNTKDIPPAAEYDIHTPLLPAVDLLKALDCFEYQSCDAEDYDTSQAHAIIAALRSNTISRLPGYANAPWVIDDK